MGINTLTTEQVVAFIALKQLGIKMSVILIVIAFL
jgi:hypothetical protein